MQIEYPPYVDRNLILVIALCETLNRTVEETRVHSVPEYVLLINWIGVSVNKEVDASTSDCHTSFANYLEMALRHTLKCSLNYIRIHSSIYHYYNIKEYFNDYQLFKRLL